MEDEPEAVSYLLGKDVEVDVEEKAGCERNAELRGEMRRKGTVALVIAVGCFTLAHEHLSALESTRRLIFGETTVRWSTFREKMGQRGGPEAGQRCQGRLRQYRARCEGSDSPAVGQRHPASSRAFVHRIDPHARDDDPGYGVSLLHEIWSSNGWLPGPPGLLGSPAEQTRV